MNRPANPLSLLKDPTLFKTQAYIDGQWIDSARRFAVTDPATNAELAQVPALEPMHAQLAIDAADAAWPAWRALPPNSARPSCASGSICWWPTPTTWPA
jgi:succinate semialdehyde dehydrogenase (EC 1.2.1.16)